MTKLDLVLRSHSQTAPERQEAVAVQIDLFLDGEDQGSVFTDEEWAEIEKTIDETGDLIPHEQVVAEMQAKFPG